MVRKAVRCRQSNRFFALCHIAVSRLSHKAFLTPALNDGGRQGVIMTENERSHSERQRRIYDRNEEKR